MRYFLLYLCFVASLFASWQEELREKIEQRRFPTWMLEQIREDLEPFAEITEENIATTMRDFPASLMLCHVLENQLTWDCVLVETCMEGRTKTFIESLQALTLAVPLPNVSFLIYISEGFIGRGKNSAPVLTWCKHKEWSRGAVCIPDYEALTGNYPLLNQVMVGNHIYRWEGKENRAFWRGTPTGGWGLGEVDYMTLPRPKLAKVAQAFPDFIDAKFTCVGAHTDPKYRDELIPLSGESVSVTDHMLYKYQILVDGHVSAFSRAYWQLFSNCVIFKQNSLWVQWFYRALQPFVHYIPYEEDGSDLVEKIRWAREHDLQARVISFNANDFANKNMRHSDIMLYVYLLLTEYAKLQKF